ncbi:MAG: restriction endonuclease subunit S [Campylobacter sp.]|uniref:restriction endonuclease subunit S n=1 Tax=Campylobacter sp. TaxID=205 RepID=UPI002AA61894|nr:restriction endonuclease subunit S [Campylobacter sp.]MCI7247482.1 restriction endonuclease subunit S [Campylobacter sp.]
MINSSEWKEFKLNELFDIERGTRFIKSKRKSGKIPLVTAGEQNQGVAEFIAYDDELKIYENHLTIDMFCNCFYRNYKFFCDDNILVFLPKIDISNKSLLFMTSVINKDKAKFGYEKQYRQKSFAEHKIKLPITQNSEIDFDFMENFIDKIEQKQRGILEFYKHKKQNGGGYELNSKTWKEFKIGDLFEVSGSKTTSKIHLEKIGAGKYPYITTQATNNGIAGYYDFYTEMGNCLTIDSAVLGSCFYQKDNFSASDHVEILRPKKFTLNSKLALYFTSLFNKNIVILGYSYTKKRNQIRIKNEIVKLPVNNLGEIDFDFMESFIKAIQKECIKGVDSYLAIATTKELIK